jgi:hypothetical protein
MFQHEKVISWPHFDRKLQLQAQKPRIKQALASDPKGFPMGQVHGTFRIGIKFAIFYV